MTEIWRDGQLDIGYASADERPHAIGSDSLWQESVVLCWWDHDQGIGGFHRIGHEPHYGGGMSFLTSFVCTREGTRHRLAGGTPFRQEDHGTSTFRFGDNYAATWDGQAHWTIREPNCVAELVVDDYMPSTDLWPRKGNTLVTNIAAAHTECPGRVRGTITLGGRRYIINGNAYRDHSWGKRDWACMNHHTWLAASCGPKHSIGHVNFFDTSGNNVFALLHYSGNDISSGTEIEIHPTIDLVDRSLKAGDILITLSGGRQVRAKFDPVGGVSFLHHGYLLTNYVCDFQIEGQMGFLIFEKGLRINLTELPSGLKTMTSNGLSHL